VRKHPTKHYTNTPPIHRSRDLGGVVGCLKVKVVVGYLSLHKRKKRNPLFFWKK